MPRSRGVSSFEISSSTPTKTPTFLSTISILGVNKLSSSNRVRRTMSVEVVMLFGYISHGKMGYKLSICLIHGCKTLASLLAAFVSRFLFIFLSHASML